MRTLPRRWSRRRLLSVSAGVAVHVFAWASVSAQPAAPRADATALSARVDGLLREHGQGIEAGLWLGGAAGTAALGGPEALTALIRQRDAAFVAVSARRYILRDRHEHGDNEAPAIALAALYQRLAARRFAGIDAATMDAIREALRRPDDPTL